MNKDLFKILKELREIQPASDYSAKSRLLIVSSAKPEKKAGGWDYGFDFNLFDKTFLAPAVISISILIIISGIYGVNYFGEKNQQRLIVRAGETNESIQIKLDEIKYLLEQGPVFVSPNAAEIQRLLGEAEGNLKDALAFNPENGGDLEEFLSKLKSAEENISKINSLIQVK